MIRIEGAHWPTKLPSCLRPPRTRAADAAIAPTANPKYAKDGTFVVASSTFAVVLPSGCMFISPFESDCGHRGGLSKLKDRGLNRRDGTRRLGRLGTRGARRVGPA